MQIDCEHCIRSERFSCLQCENPKRDLPIGIVGSLLVTTLLYVATAGVRLHQPCSSCF